MSKKNELSIATIKDVDEIMKYIDLEWKRDHILSVNKDFFNFQHENGENINLAETKALGCSIKFAKK